MYVSPNILGINWLYLRATKIATIIKPLHYDGVYIETDFFSKNSISVVI
jgi:hypothetical protein